MPFAEAGRSALQKVAGVMGSVPRNAASRLVSRIRVVQGPGGDAATPVAEVIQQAILDATTVELTYRDGRARETVRVVEPLGLFGTRNGWYLAAWCRLRQAPRAFRLDRVTHVAVTHEPVTPRSLDAVLSNLPFELAEPTLI
jgi:predicted DNA-binding transcriptional regulator YafY